jgi:hypothetical protein
VCAGAFFFRRAFLAAALRALLLRLK